MRIHFFLCLLMGTLVFPACQPRETSAPESLARDTVREDTAVSEVYEPKLLYGINVDSLLVFEGVIQRNESLSDILLPLHVDHKTIFELAGVTRDVFDVRKLAAGKKYTILLEEDSVQRATKLIYEPSKTEYVVFHITDSVYAEKHYKEVAIAQKTLEGRINHSLAVTIEEQGAPVQLTNDFVDVFAWQIDFFRLQEGDYFKVVYEEKSIEDEVVGIGDILTIYFEHQGNPYFAFAFDQGEGLDYFDEEGNSLRKAFLKYPLEFSRISSRYSLSRFHPVQRRWKAHLGTDFVASRGTPIRAVGDGIVTEARYSRYNGNYIKIRHNATYTTQYLHMSGFASGVKTGQKVRQGQTIGYVGSTGLATGNHLCYRFWKNGVQIDALKVELPPSHPVKKEMMDSFTTVKDSLIRQLQLVQSGMPVAVN